MTIGLVWVLLMFSFCFILFSIFICMSVSLYFMYVYHMHTWCSRGSKEGIKSPRIGVIDGCEPPCWY